MWIDFKDCRNSSPRTQPTQQQPGRQGTSGTLTQNRQIAAKARTTEKKEAEVGMDALELKIGEKVKVLNGACMEAEI